MFSRVLIVSASAGNGHIKAAEAVEAAVRSQNPDAFVMNVDCLKFARPFVRWSYGKGYIHMVNRAPAALGWLYDAADTPWSNEYLRLLWHRFNFSRLTKLMVKYQPDLIVNTHFIGSELAAFLLCKGRIKAANTVVVTDFDAHSMWLCRHYDRYFVALEETRQHMHQLGIPAENITVSGIPINPVFALPKSKQEMRRQLGLDPELTTLLLSTGGLGVGPITEVAASLSHLHHPVQVLAMCGKNEQLMAQMTELAANSCERVRIVPVGYTNKMDEYMSASDIVLGKPGGLTTSEALAKGLAFVIVNPIPGQEARNSDHLLEEGAAIKINNLPAMGYKLDSLLAQPERIAAMQANAKRLGRPTAAKDIATLLAQAPAVHTGACTEGCPTCKRPRRLRHGVSVPA